MDSKEAKQKTLENSKLYRDILNGIQHQIEKAKFEYNLHNEEVFRDWTDLAIAIISKLREMGYKVEYHKFTYCLTISWR